MCYSRLKQENKDGERGALHLTVVITVSLILCFLYGIDGQPVQGDRAYFLYMAQTVYRGDALYATTTFGYPPYGPLLSALTMSAGAPLNLPSYLTPRILGVLVAVVNPCLLYVVVNRIASNRREALLAALMMAAFGYQSILSVTNLEPKIMVTFCTLIAMWAYQTNRWIAVGSACGCAVMFWQPAVVVSFTMIVGVLFQNHDKRMAQTGRVFLGLILSLLPAVIFLTIKQDWEHFYFQTILRKAITDLPQAGQNPFRWFYSWGPQFWTEAHVMFIGALGFLISIKGIFQQPGMWWRSNIVNRSGNVALLTIAWSIWNMYEFDGAPDLIPMLPLISFWTAKFINDNLLASESDRRTISSSKRKMFLTGGCRVIACWAWLLSLFGDAFFYKTPISLNAQKEMVPNFMHGLTTPEELLAFNAEEFYVLTNTRSPVPYTQMRDWVEVIVERSEPQGSAGFISKIAKNPPLVVIIREIRPVDSVARQITTRLSSYGLTTVTMPRAYTPLPTLLQQKPIRYDIYRRGQ